MKICFWGSIASTLKGNTEGGSELQIALLAKTLAQSGHEVVIVDFSSAQDFITPEGIKVVRVKGWNYGIRFIRIFTHRLPNLYKSLKNQKADIYYCRMRDFMHILAFWSARKAGSKFILATASDLDTMGFRMRLKYYYIPNTGHDIGLWWLFNGFLNEIIHPWLLRKADMVFVQHEGQRQILLKKHIRSVLFPNLFNLIPKSVSSDNSIYSDFIYVGSLDKRKGFKEFFEIVKRASYLSFRVVGQPRDIAANKYYEKLISFNNVTLLGRLSHLDTINQISASKALISTSRMEGFPNVFIEAWACGIPVISLYVDPGSVIEKEGLGEVAYGDLDRLLQVLDNIQNTKEFGKRAKSYIEKKHFLNENKINEISNLFNDIFMDNSKVH